MWDRGGRARAERGGEGCGDAVRSELDIGPVFNAGEHDERARFAVEAMELGQGFETIEAVEGCLEEDSLEVLLID